MYYVSTHDMEVKLILKKIFLLCVCSSHNWKIQLLWIYSEGKNIGNCLLVLVLFAGLK